MKAIDVPEKLVKVALICGICGAPVYPMTETIACHLDQGYSFNGQAISELFFIGSSTSQRAVTLFTMSGIILDYNQALALEQP